MIKGELPTGETVYEERRFSLRKCLIPRSDDQEEYRAVIIHPGSVIILALDHDGDVVLIGNHRWQIGQRLLELPAGTMDKSEVPAVCAARELIEETGYRAENLVPFHTFYPLPGGSTEVMYAFVATGLHWVGQALEPDEDIHVEKMSLAAIQYALCQGEIVDGKTIAMLSLYLLRKEQIVESAD